MGQNFGKGKEFWNSFNKKESCSFLQSWEWGEFQENFGRRVWRFCHPRNKLGAGPELDSGSMDWTVQFIETPLPMGKKYWYGPRGPIFKILNTEFQISNKFQISNNQIQNFIEITKNVAEKEGVMFFRIGPEWPADVKLEAELEIAGFKKLRYDIEPSQTLILDIAKSEEEILAQMHSKTRYNIGLAQKKGVLVKMINVGDSDFQKYFEDFWRLISQTAKRQKIALHPKDYYLKQFEINGDLKIELFLAEYQNKMIAANLVSFFNDRATYLHGGSDNEHRSLMAPHLLQWEQIHEAKRRGCSEYDFWGVDEKKWPGVTRFKRGFGGREVKYIGIWDYPLDKKWYLIYRGVQRFRR